MTTNTFPNVGAGKTPTVSDFRGAHDTTVGRRPVSPPYGVSARPDLLNTEDQMAPSTQYVIEHQRHVYTGPHAGDPGFTAWVPVDKLDAVYHRDALDAYLERQGEGARHGRYRVLKDTGFGLDVLEYVVAKRNVFDVERVKSAAVGEDVVVGLTEAA